jgi:hypothetical protein
MKSSYRVALLLVLGILCGCNKEKQIIVPATTEVSGRVLIKGTARQASQYPVTVRVYKQTDPKNTAVGQLVAETKTDSLGRYRLHFERCDANTRYYLRLYAEIAQHFAPDEQRVYLETGENQCHDLYYIPQAWLKLHIRRNNALPEEELRIYVGGKELYTFKGKTDEILFCGPKPGNTALLITSGLRRSGTLQFSRADTLYLAAYDTSYQLLNL